MKFTRTKRNCQSPVGGEERRGEELRQRGVLKDRTAEEEMDLQEEKTVNKYNNTLGVTVFKSKK